jgi:murein DD-endopeptidase MepM/ murein hydrolase activator NlpD
MSRYFVSDTRDDDDQPIDATYWRERQGFGGLVGPGDSYERLRAGESVSRGSDPYHTNLNLLAHAVGDSPTPLGQPVPSRSYSVRVGLALDLQPFALDPDGDPTKVAPVELVIGRNLARFLDDPLRTGRTLDLALPFFDEDVVIGPTGGWLRPSGDRTFHGGIDFSTRPRRLFPVAASASGVVTTLLYTEDNPNNRGVVLEHDAGGTFRTIYQHMDEDSVVVAVGDTVTRGQELGRISAQIQDDGGDNSHLHFAVAVRAKEFVYEGEDVPELWYFIDPFGVYDYRHDTETYVPRTKEGMWESIRGAARSIHWSSEIPAESLPIERLTEGYQGIRLFQIRVRRNDRSGGELPPEHDQCLVWLADDRPFFVPIRQATDRSMELQLIETLRQAFVNEKEVRLAYRFVGRNRLVTAAWARV